MRSHTSLISLCPLAAALSSLFAATPAPACGMPFPSVFVITAHWTPNRVPLRQFATLGEAADAPALGDAAWELVAPGSYDGTEVAPAAPLPSRTLTLVGARGTAVVATTNHVFLTPDAGRKAVDALEIGEPTNDLGHVYVAIAGRHPDARWTEVVSVPTTAEASTWLASHATDLVGNAVYTARVGDVELVSGITAAGEVTYARRGTEELGHMAAAPLGLLEVNGEQLIEGMHAGELRTVAIY